MIKKYFFGVAFAVLLTVVAVPADVRAESTVSNTSALSEKLKMLENLMKQVETLKKQLAELRGEIKSDLKDGLREGMSDDDVKKVQELLATDPSIYPKGLISGYYGPLTKEAIVKLQTRHGLKATGEVDSETKELLLEYFKEKANGKFPPGLLQAPGIDKKMLERLKIRRDGKKYLDCDDRIAAGPLCKNKRDDEDEDEDEDENEDEDEDENEDEDEDEDEETNTPIKTTATSAINAAKTAIKALEEAIADADDEEAIEEAEDEQMDAEKYLSEAEDYFAEGKYRNAYYKAMKAKSEANKALRELL